MSVVRSSDTGRIALAFSLAAIRQVEDPAAVFEDARRWSRQVGIVGDDPAAIEAFLAEHGLQQDFDQGDRDRWLALAELAAASPAPRLVHVGAGPERRPFTEEAGWEYLTIDEAAANAGWSLATEPATPDDKPEQDGGENARTQTGLLARLRRLLGGLGR